MADDRGIRIIGDANGSVVVTGDHNVFVFVDLPKDLLERLRSGQISAEAAGGIPLPTVTLTIAPTTAKHEKWSIGSKIRLDAEPVESVREVDPPWHDRRSFSSDLTGFWNLSQKTLEKEDERATLATLAIALGDALAAILTAAEVAALVRVAQGDPPPPLLVIESNDDLVLALTVLEREFEVVSEDRQFLKAGFVGRRAEMHEIRRRIRSSERVHVLHGLGGLGKSAIAFEAVKLIARQRITVTLWCDGLETVTSGAAGLLVRQVSESLAKQVPGFEGLVQQVDRAGIEDPAERWTAFLAPLVGRADLRRLW